MVVLIDANVLLDYVFRREPEFQYADKIIGLCAESKIKGYIAFHTVSIVWYVLRKVPEQQRRKIFKDLLGIVKVCSANHDAVVEAIEKKSFVDFEDCLQDKCAVNIHAQYIITGNVKDYSEAEIQAVSSRDFCEIIDL